MLQLHVTDDRGAVTTHQANTFPFLIGRSANAQLRFTAPGVWEEHARIRLAEEQGTKEKRFFIEAAGHSLLSVNGEVASSQRLSIGDEISIGAIRVVVTLSPARQTALALHESMVWALLLLAVVGEALVIHFAR
jgi:hypothetical protein